MSDIINEYKLECYQKIKPLGTKGNLWLVEDSIEGKRFVMRKLSRDSQRVYEILAEIHHPNIIEILDVFLYKESLYVIEEYLEWKLLSDVIAKKTLSQKHVLSIGTQILSALSLLYEYNVIHRDIKPENIMIDEKGTSKLIDFDIARLFSENKETDTTAKGSKDYAPPEQFGFTQSDCRTDIYALGVTLNELATGKLPEERICTRQLGVIVRHCTEFDPKRRYQTAEQALKHIKWLKKRKAVLVSTFIMVFCVTFAAALLIKNNFLFFTDNSDIATVSSPESEESVHLPEESFSEKNEKDWIASTELADRIISVEDMVRYPSVLLTEDGTCEFMETLKEGEAETVVSSQKTQEKLSMSCASPDGTKGNFEFEDVFSEEYSQLGYSINTDIEGTSPEYEIVVDDIDQNGTKEFLVALAWRKRIDTANPEYRYYLTEYSIVWAIYRNEKGDFARSKPLYFEGCSPSLQEDIYLYDPDQSVWYVFDSKNETWLLY